MKLLLNPMVLRAGLLLLVGFSAFVLGAFLIRRLRRGLAEEAMASAQSPMAPEGLPVHTYHAVIQQLKQQKHELAAQQLAERRKAKASDTLSATVLANLSCGVLFFNPSGLVRQANAVARKLLGYASPIGMRAGDLFRTATMRVEEGRACGRLSIDEALAPAFRGESAVRGLALDYTAPHGSQHVLELTVSPVLAEDASLMGAAAVLTDKTEIARIRQDQEAREEISAGMAQGLRASLTTIAGCAQQLARTRDPELARQLADEIAGEAAQLDRKLGSFLVGAKAAAGS